MNKSGQTVDARPYELLHILCRLGQGMEDDLGSARLNELLRAFRANPAALVRLRCNTHSVFSPLNPGRDADTSESSLVNAKRDLDIMQRLALTPGAVLPAIDLFRKLLDAIPEASGICGYGVASRAGVWRTDGGVTAADYSAGRALGLSAVFAPRSLPEKQRAKAASVEALRSGAALRIRPFHLMCMACFWGDRKSAEPVLDENLVEIVEIMRARPDIPVMLIEGCCDVCPPCGHLQSSSNYCTGRACMGLRDQKKELDILHLLGMTYGDALPANELLRRLFTEIRSTTQICGFGDGVERSPEWRVCGGPNGDANYIKARAVGLWVPGAAPDQSAEGRKV